MFRFDVCAYALVRSIARKINARVALKIIKSLVHRANRPGPKKKGEAKIDSRYSDAGFFSVHLGIPSLITACVTDCDSASLIRCFNGSSIVDNALMNEFSMWSPRNPERSNGTIDYRSASNYRRKLSCGEWRGSRSLSSTIREMRLSRTKSRAIVSSSCL